MAEARKSNEKHFGIRLPVWIRRRNYDWWMVTGSGSKSEYREQWMKLRRESTGQRGDVHEYSWIMMDHDATYEYTSDISVSKVERQPKRRKDIENSQRDTKIEEEELIILSYIQCIPI